MLTDLWLLGLFFLASALISLAFFSYSWIYFDAFLSQRRSKDIMRAAGGVLIGLQFILGLLNFNVRLGNLTFLLLFILSLGLFLIFYGNYLEPVPGLPEEKIAKAKQRNYLPIFIFFATGVVLAIINNVFQTSVLLLSFNFILFLVFLIYIVGFRKDYLEPVRSQKTESDFQQQISPSLLLIVIPFFTPLLISIFIFLQNLKKVREGLSMEFRLLLFFWLSFAFYVLALLAQLLGQNYFLILDSITRQYSIVWIASQVLLIIAAILMFRWISKFISFRVFTKIFLYIWQISILLTVAIATLFSAMMIRSSESQLQELLVSNSNLISFTLEQVKASNQDALSQIVNDKQLTAAVQSSDTSNIENRLIGLVNNTSFLDRVIVTNQTGELIYDSLGPINEGQNLSDLPIITTSIYTRSDQASFSKAFDANNMELVYQFTKVLLDQNGALIGIVSTLKNINDNYLDLLKARTGQELIIYVDGRRTASTVLERDGVSRLQNIPLTLEGDISTTSGLGQDSVAGVSLHRGRILTTPYYIALSKLQDSNGNDLGYIVTASEQSILVETTQNLLLSIFVYSLLLIILLTLPSYLLAKSLQRNLSA